jgi:D-alanine-D-alanine ligase
MKVAIIYNKDINGVINTFGIQNKEFYSKKTVMKVAQSLEKSGHNVAVLDGNKQIIERLENFMPRVNKDEQMGMIFNMAYGIQGESRYTHIPSMLEMLGLPYVGSSPSGHALALDKVLTKIIWQKNNLPTPEFWVFNSAKEKMENIKFPVIVKPKMESVSFGLKVVYDTQTLREAVDYIVSEFHQQALVEQFIRGREFCVGLIGNSPVEAFPVLEIDLNGDPDGIQTVDDKKNQPKNKICPADLPEEISDKMKKLSIDAFNALNLRDFSRVDIRMDEGNNIYLLEINSMASLGETGSYPTAAKVAGYSFENLVNKMLDVASVRYFSGNTASANITKETSLASKLRNFIKIRQQQTEKLLEKLVNTNTYVRNVEGVNYCVGLISTELSQLGFSYEVYPQQEIGNILYLSNSLDSSIDFLVLLTLDSKTRLQNHEQFIEHEQYIDGTGVLENKGGIAVFLAALRSLRFSRLLRKVKIGILLITDTTLDNRYSAEIIRQKSLSAEKVIALSGASKDGGVVLSRSGSALYNLRLKLSDNNNPEAVATTALQFNKTLSSIIEISKNDPDNIIAPFNMEFNSNIFKNFAYGFAGISVRYNSKDILAKIEKKINKILSEQKRNKNFQIHFEGGAKRPPLVENEKSKQYYEEIQSIARSIFVRINREHRWSSGDICHIKREIPILDGLGPIGENVNSDKERILRHSLIERSLLLALILNRK